MLVTSATCLSNNARVSKTTGRDNQLYIMFLKMFNFEFNLYPVVSTVRGSK